MFSLRSFFSARRAANSEAPAKTEAPKAPATPADLRSLPLRYVLDDESGAASVSVSLERPSDAGDPSKRQASVVVDGNLNGMAGGFGSSGPFKAQLTLERDGDVFKGRFASYDGVDVEIGRGGAKVRYRDFALGHSFDFNVPAVPGTEP
jgi:hypothetical protein